MAARRAATLLSLLVLLFAAAETQTVPFTLATQYGGSVLSMEQVLSGGEPLTLRLGAGYAFKPRVVTENGFFRAVKGDLPEWRNGVERYRDTLFRKENATLSADGRTLTVLLNAPATMGFVGAEDAARFDFNSFYFTGGTGTAAAALRITGMTTNGTASATPWTAQTEFDIRVKQTALTVHLRFNALNVSGLARASDAFEVSSDDSTLTSLANLFEATAAPPPMSSVTVTLRPQQDFDISAPATLTLRFIEAALVMPLLPSPALLRFTVAPIDSHPVVLCVLDQPTVTEEELRAGAVTRRLELRPPVDKFRRFAGDEALLLASIQTPASINVTVRLDEFFAEVTLATAPSFDTDERIPVTIPPPRVLLERSYDAGCGAAVITVRPSPGIVRALAAPANLTERDIAARDHAVPVELTFDAFRRDATHAAGLATQAIVGSGPVATAENAGFNETLAGTLRLVLDAVNSSRATIVVPRSARYNIPVGIVELITLGLGPASVASGVVPVSVDLGFAVTATPPVMEVFFGGDENATEISVTTLWRHGALLTLRLTGETWDPNSRSLWNERHPRVRSATQVPDGEVDFGFERIKARMAAEGTPVVDYTRLNLTLREAVLPIAPMPLLSLRYLNERVFVSDVAQLILGRPTLPRVSFNIVPPSPDDIVVTFSGSRPDYYDMDETEVRRGFWFAVECSLQVWAAAAVTNTSLLFDPQDPLFPYFAQCTGNASVRPNVLNVTCPPTETLDIDTTTQVALTVPDIFYYGVVPTDSGYEPLTVRAHPAPVITFRALAAMTERDVRADDPAALLLTVDTTMPFAADLATMDYATALRTPDGAPHVLRLAFSARLSDTRAVFAVLGNATYDIAAPDEVYLRLDRRFFVVGERSGRLNFTVAPSPGRAVASDLPPERAVSAFWADDLVFNVTLYDEGVVGSTLRLATSATALVNLSGTAGTGIDGLIAEGWTATATVVAAAPFETTLRVVLPSAARFFSAIPLLLSFTVPANETQSGLAPSMTNASLRVVPSASAVSVAGPAVITEPDVVTGGVVYTVVLAADLWGALTPASAASTAGALSYAARRYNAGREGNLTLAAGSSDGAAQMVLPPSAFTFPTPTTLRIELQPVVGYNAAADEVLVVGFPSGVTVSGHAPLAPNLTVRVVAGAPTIVTTGTARVCSSRELVVGGIELHLELRNDLFRPGLSSARGLCPFAECVAELSLPPRNLTLRFGPSLSNLVMVNTTFPVALPTDALVSGVPPPPVTLFVYVSNGLVDIRFDSWSGGLVFPETTVRRGELPQLRAVLTGDRVVASDDLVAHSLAAAVRCQPADPAGFCARAPALFLPRDYGRHRGGTELRLRLQPDEAFDVAAPAIVNVSLGGLAVESGLAPQGHLLFTVTPVPGEYVVSTTAAVIDGARLAHDFSFRATISVVLLSERFVADPLPCLLAAMASTASPQVERTGFMQLRDELFLPARLTLGGRKVDLTLRHHERYAVSNAETVTVSVPASCTQSGLAPRLTAAGQSFRIDPSGGRVTLDSPASTTAATVRAHGLNITLRNDAEWSEVGVTSGNVPTALVSDTAPVAEPAGFAALKSEMLGGLRPDVTFNRLTIRIRPDPRYALTRPEVITVLVRPSWTRKGNPTFPERISVTVHPGGAVATADVAVYVAAPVDAEGLRGRLAVFIGSPLSAVVHAATEPYRPDIEGAFFRVLFAVHTAPGRAKDDALRVLFEAPEAAVEAHLSALAVDRPGSDARLSAAVVATKLGITTAAPTGTLVQSMWWVYALLGGGVVVCGSLFVLYRWRVRERLRPLGAHGRAADERVLREGGQLPPLPRIEEDAIAGERSRHDPLDLGGGILAVPGAGVDEGLDGPSFADPAVAGRPVALDGGVVARQPRGVILPPPDPLDLPPVPGSTEPPMDMAFYPPDVPNARRFQGSGPRYTMII